MFSNVNDKPSKLKLVTYSSSPKAFQIRSMQNIFPSSRNNLNGNTTWF